MLYCKDSTGLLLLTAQNKLSNVRDKPKKRRFISSVQSYKIKLFQDFLFYRNEKHGSVDHGHTQHKHKNCKLKHLLFSHFPLLGADVQNCGDKGRYELTFNTLDKAETKTFLAVCIFLCRCRWQRKHMPYLDNFYFTTIFCYLFHLGQSHDLW